MKATVAIRDGLVVLSVESDNPLEADCLKLLDEQSIARGGIWMPTHGCVPDAQRRSLTIAARPVAIEDAQPRGQS